MLRWSLPSKIYIQFTVFNTYFLAKLSFTNKRYHLQVLEKCLYMPQEVRSIIYFRQFIHPLSLHSGGNGTSFAFTLYNHRIGKSLWRHIFKQLLFCFIFFFHLFIYRSQIKIRLMTLSKSYLYTFFFKSSFLVYWASFIDICLYFINLRFLANAEKYIVISLVRLIILQCYKIN